MSKFVQKILLEGEFVFPKTLKKLQTEDWKNISVNSIFKNKFVEKYRNKWKKLQERYYKEGGRKKYGGEFAETGTERRVISVNDIYPGQVGVSREAILEKINGSNDHSSQLPEALLLQNEGNPIILLIDGHHRVAAKILLGEKEVELSLKVKDF